MHHPWACVYNFWLKAQHFIPCFFVYRCKCCSGAGAGSRKLKIKGKGERDRRWKRAIRLAAAEWISASLSTHCGEALSTSGFAVRHPAAEQWWQLSGIFYNTIKSPALCVYSKIHRGCKACSSPWQARRCLSVIARLIKVQLCQIWG